eukprot:TRINITY_DN28706_c0_g1_i1.p1 TRINITY_DN28706_c0_g1~~TRINITY_DN28706_c0_g1_i1.p1  ORF type:complete len:167 (+),score=49.90 TRINITY_DN28706_c0_g1_i1:105-605(+)
MSRSHAMSPIVDEIDAMARRRKLTPRAVLRDVSNVKPSHMPIPMRSKNSTPELKKNSTIAPVQREHLRFDARGQVQARTIVQVHTEPQEEEQYLSGEEEELSYSSSDEEGTEFGYREPSHLNQGTRSDWQGTHVKFELDLEDESDDECLNENGETGLEEALGSCGL